MTSKKAMTQVAVSLVCCMYVVFGWYVAYDVPREQYTGIRDINIGVLVTMSEKGTSGQLCSDTLRNVSVLYSQGVALGLEQINQNRSPAPPIGFVMLDDCGKESVAVSQSLAFITAKTDPDCTVSDPLPDELPSYDVVAVIGTDSSLTTVAVAHVLGTTDMPLISYGATSDELSNQHLFPNFIRTVPPDKFLIQAHAAFIRHFGWTYVSVVYIDSKFGESGYNVLREMLKKDNICLAGRQEVSEDMTKEELSKAVSMIMKNVNARVVVLFTTASVAVPIIRQVNIRWPRHFIWIIGHGGPMDSMPVRNDTLDFLYGVFVVTTLNRHTINLEEKVQTLTPFQTTDPWFHKFWEQTYNCSLKQGTCPETAQRNLSVEMFGLHGTAAVVDAIRITVAAIDDLLLGTKCKQLLRQAKRYRDCVTGKKLVEQFKQPVPKMYFQTSTGQVRFDENGDILGKYVVVQLVPPRKPPYPLDVNIVANIAHPSYLSEEGSGATEWATVTLTGTRSMWDFHELYPGEEDNPHSLCSMPCGPGQAQITERNKCCWSCKTCQPNEKISASGARCVRCPKYHWPNPSNRTTCAVLKPVAPQFGSLQCLSQWGLAAVMLIQGSGVFVLFYRHHRARIIAASTAGLSYFMLLGISLGFITVINLCAHPTYTVCLMDYLLSCASFALVYGPLFVRVMHIYAVALSGRESFPWSYFSDSSHDMRLTFGLLSVQVVICGASLVPATEWVMKSMDDPMEPRVELTCAMPVFGAIFFSIYNLLQIVACTFLAYKTRHLSDNFHETTFISMCSTTNIIIWLALMPAYVLVMNRTFKVLMLALAIIFSHSVALVCLFFPKIYAIYKVEGAADSVETVGSRVNPVKMD